MTSSRKYVSELFKSRGEVGNKAQNLSTLHKLGLKVPMAYVIGYSAYMDYKIAPENTLDEIIRELVDLLSTTKSYAVRSSTNLEDSSQFSYAGQFKTVLNLKIDEIIKAITDIWDSTQNPNIIRYQNIGNLSDKPTQTSIIIQEMVYPEYSGVIFTKNPVTGLDEVIVEIVKGLGTSLVQDGVTPERWISKWGGWREKPDDPSLDDVSVGRLVQEAKLIEKKYGKPVDLEFAYNGKDFFWLQLREITTINGLKLYSNRISREMIPGIILPLVWSINIPINERSWKMLLRDLFGSSIDLISVKLAKQFYYRAYFNMGLFGDLFSLLGMPRESIELIIGVEVPGKEKPKFKPSLMTLRYAKNIMALSMGITRLPHRINRHIHDQKHFLNSMRKINPDKLSVTKKIELIDNLIEVGIKSSYIVTLTQMLFSMFSMMSNKKDFQIDSKIDSNKRLFLLSSLYQKLNFYEKHLVDDNTFLNSVSMSENLKNFKDMFNIFLIDFGHYSEHSNDLSFITWRERPEQVVEMIKNYPIYTTKNISDKNDINKNNISYKYKLYRETVTYLYTQNYSFFRPLFLSISKDFIINGFIKKEDDIFYLTLNEIKDIINGSDIDYDSIISKRKWEVENVRNINPPELIFSDNEPPIIKENVYSLRLKGISASRGRVAGHVKIVKNFEDSNKVCDGDIIVIPYSDVSWTVLFHKVKGIISESGGILSHCAIVARECRIPAVVSVKNAFSLKDGMQVIIDGDLGEITIGN